MLPRTTILPERRDILLIALGGSLLFHLVAFAGFELGVRMSWWSRSALASLLSPPILKTPALNAHVPTLSKPKADKEMPPLIFVDVSPEQATAAAPKNTKYYSAANSQAANQTIKMQSEVPNIEGKQTKMVRTLDKAPEKAFPLQPTPKPTPEPQTKAPPEPKAAPKPGDLALAKPANSPKIGEDLSKRPGEQTEKVLERPRTVQEAMRRLNPTLAGEKMKQEGGRPRIGIEGLDVRQSPFGRYDEAFIKAVQNRWYDLIDERRFAAAVTGKVQVTFRLNYDGRITAAKVTDSTVDIIMSHICQKAIEDPQPYEPWPSDMRSMIGANYRELTFTFYYE